MHTTKNLHEVKAGCSSVLCKPKKLVSYKERYAHLRIDVPEKKMVIVGTPKPLPLQTHTPKGEPIKKEEEDFILSLFNNCTTE